MTAIITFSMWQITVTEVVIVVIIMGFVIAIFMMINFFFQRYTITLITLETSSSFLGKWSWLCLVTFLLPTTLFWTGYFLTDCFSMLLLFVDPAAVFRSKIWRVCYCSLIVPYTADVICSFDFFFDDSMSCGNELLSIFFIQEYLI